jgi:hypothetical protein
MATKKAAKRVPAARSGARRGPKPDVLKIRGRWQDAMKQSLQKKKPAGSWPTYTNEAIDGIKDVEGTRSQIFVGGVRKPNSPA